MDRSFFKAALYDDEFEAYYRRTGGGGGFGSASPLYTKEDVINDYMTESLDEWLTLDHRYINSISGSIPAGPDWREKTTEAINEALKTMTREEIIQTGRPMETEQQVKIFNLNQEIIEKVWRYYVTYRHGLPPQHPKAAKLHEEFSSVWDSSAALPLLATQEPEPEITMPPPVSEQPIQAALF